MICKLETVLATFTNLIHRIHRESSGTNLHYSLKIYIVTGFVTDQCRCSVVDVDAHRKKNRSGTVYIYNNDKGDADVSLSLDLRFRGSNLALRGIRYRRTIAHPKSAMIIASFDGACHKYFLIRTVMFSVFG